MAVKNAHQRQVAPFLAVVQYTFMPNDAPLVVAYITTPEQILEMVEVVGQTGYEISQRYDKTRESWSVCLKGADRDCVNAGKWMYGNGETLHLAFCSVMYKHFEIFGQKEWVGTSSSAGMTFS